MNRTKISYAKWKNTESIVMENDLLRVVVIPAMGGKTVSVFHKEMQFELLAQHNQEEYKFPQYNDSFEQFDASGFDDGFPTITACEFNYKGKTIRYPDHGEIWSAQFDAKIDDEKLFLSYQSSKFDYMYYKIITLKQDEVVYSYRIINTSEENFPCIWAFHCLVRYEEDMKLFYPPDVKVMENVFESSELGAVGQLHQAEKSIYKFDSVANSDSKTMIKYYIKDPINNGTCGYIYPTQHIRCTLSYDTTELPYLGFWLTSGGFRGDYNCAFEPTNGYYDAIDTASEKNKLYVLKPNVPLEFSITLRLKHDETT